MRFHLVVNPSAGRGRAGPLGIRVRDALLAAGHEATHYATRAPGDATHHAAGLSSRACDRLVVVGGDGTLKEVVDGRLGAPPWPIALVPMGTANVVGREVGMHGLAEPATIAGALLSANPWRVDVMRVEATGRPPQWALANVGAGLDAEVVHRVARRRAAGAGGGYGAWAAPIWQALTRGSAERLLVEVDGRRTFLAAGVVVQSATNYGGLFRLCPGAAMDSGRLDVALIRGSSARDRLRVLLRMGLRDLARDHAARFVQGSRVEVRASRPVPVQADGDPAGTTDVRVEILPQALALLRHERPALALSS